MGLILKVINISTVVWLVYAMRFNIKAPYLRRKGIEGLAEPTREQVSEQQGKLINYKPFNLL
jgi:hypothetical protein